jgi:hypothetical protein
MSNLRRVALLVMVVLAGLASPVLAQSTPQSVAEAYVAAIRADGMSAAAEYIHPDELRRFKDMLSPLIADPTSPTALGFVQTVFGPKATVESVAALDPLSFMRGFMGFVDSQLKAVNMSIGNLQVLGAVPEGEIVHLVTRGSAGAMDMQLTQLEVMSLKPHQDTWKLLLSGKIEGFAQALRSRAAAGP